MKRFIQKSQIFSFLVLSFAYFAFCLNVVAQEGSDSGGGNPADMTATQLITSGRAAFFKGEISKAQSYFESFMKDYGESKEAEQYFKGFMHIYALCLVSSGKYKKAYEVINRCFSDKLFGEDENLERQFYFWKGVCEMQNKDYKECRASFNTFYEKSPNSPQAVEGAFLGGLTYLQSGEFAKAAEFFSKLKKSLKRGVDKGRAAVYQLFSYMRGNDKENAYDLIISEYPKITKVAEIITFQTFTMKLGELFLGNDKYYKAIACFQRVWTRERLLKHQKDRLKKLKKLERRIKKDPKEFYRVYQISYQIKGMEKEITRLDRVTNFDAALKFRMATAYQQLEKYIEAGTVLESILYSLPVSKMVEKATLSLVQTWSEAKRFERVVKVVDYYREKFDAYKKNNENYVQITYLQGEAFRELGEYASAIKVFDEITTLYKKSPTYSKAFFMKGFSLLEKDDNKTAIEVFQKYRKTFPKSPIVDDSYYWEGMAHSFSSEFEKCLEHMKSYIEKFKNGRYLPNAYFRLAYSSHGAQKFDEAIKQFNDYLKRYPDQDDQDEALLLLGEGHMALGDIETGLEYLNKVSQALPQYYDDAMFQIGRALKLLKEFNQLRNHFKNFIEKNPNHPRIAEAIYWIGWSYLAQNKLDDTKKLYWDTIAEYGENPRIFGVEDILRELPRIYRREEGGGEALIKKIISEQQRALTRGQNTLFIRLVWIESYILRKVNPKKSVSLLLKLVPYLDIKKHNPIVSIKIANAFLAEGLKAKAKNIYEQIKKWHPRTIGIDHVYATLGIFEFEDENYEKALEFFERFDKVNFGSRRFIDVLKAKATIFTSQKKYSEAKAVHLSIIDNKRIKANIKVESYYKLGELSLAMNKPKDALAYFEQIYISYVFYQDWVVKAYFSRGETLENLNLKKEALEVYNEMVSIKELKDYPETKLAKTRISKLAPLYPEVMNQSKEKPATNEEEPKKEVKEEVSETT